MFLGETCLLKRSKDSWQVLRIFSSVRGGQTLIFLFIQLQRPSPSTMQTPSPIVLRIRLACLETRARSRGRKSAESEKTAEKCSRRRSSIAYSTDGTSTT